MGKFASVNALSLPLVTEMVEAEVQDTDLAMQDLIIIIDSFTPPSLIIPPPDAYSLAEATEDALIAASKQTVLIFNAQYPHVQLPASNLDYGAVLDYTVRGDIKTLENAISNDLNDWGIDTGFSDEIAAILQPKADKSQFTPLSTYGKINTNNPDNSAENLYWVASFAVFHLSKTDYAVIYGFSAAIA
ncbi:hypothetical protein [Pedobacter sp. MR2016-24]|uniref:hypothetical protein n=1 Tax=Pedobacter sp. MR2016-24 TaxID=2994466 RepID=UPI0022470747|nr:hypothetical protein [Pedobacter sp. MR2016-24]MCX2486662.1 hypothetical protein [Pedobacter sp. MR2016-24]